MSTRDPHSGPSVAVVIPAFDAEDTIASVVEDFADLVQWVIVIDDGSRDRTADSLASMAKRSLVILRHEKNKGVGAATKTGILEAFRRQADIVVKVDADGQMESQYLPLLLNPLLSNKADLAKANRWHDLKALTQMPSVRRWGNLFLSFFTRVGSGYWKVFDPSNGYIAWRTELLRRIDLARIPDRWAFETAMLVEAGMVRGVVEDVGIPASYPSQKSHLRIRRAFPGLFFLLLGAIPRRIWRQYFILDFGPASLLLVAGIPLVACGAAFGVYHWLQSVLTGIPATAGTVIIAALPVVLGFNCLLQALMIDVTSQPSRKISSDLEVQPGGLSGGATAN